MLVLDDRTKITSHTLSDNNYCMDIYELETRYGCSTREVTVYHELGLNPTRNTWRGDMIAFGEWRDLDEDEVKQAKQFLKEKGYL